MTFTVFFLILSLEHVLLASIKESRSKIVPTAHYAPLYLFRHKELRGCTTDDANPVWDVALQQQYILMKGKNKGKTQPAVKNTNRMQMVNIIDIDSPDIYHRR